MKRTISFVAILTIVFSAWFLILSKPITAVAVDPSYPDQGCVNGVQNSGIFTWASQTPGMVFVPRFNWLNAVSVRIKGTNPTGTPRVEAQIWDWHSSPHRMIATHSVDLENRVDEYWQHITESSQDIDPGKEYALILVPKNGSQIYWSGTTNTSCYDRGFAMIDGERYNSIDFGFVTYGWYDASNPSSDGATPPSGSPDSGSSTGTSGSTGAPSADPLAGQTSSTAGSSVAESTDNAADSSSSSDVGAKNNSAGTAAFDWAPNVAEILSLSRADDGGGILADIFSSPIWIYLFPLLSLLFWVIVIWLIVFLVRRNKKKKEQKSASVTEKKEEKQ